MMNKAAKRTYDKVYRATHRSERNVYIRAYNAAHKNELRAHSKAYRKAHKSEHNARRQAWRHSTGRTRPMAEAKDSGIYLGVFVAERVLSTYFDNIIQMPPNNPGFDFLCGRGYKIDVKSACLYHSDRQSPQWVIRIKRNVVADYFLILLFNDRTTLEPMHVLLVPGSVVNDRVTIGISSNPRYFAKWSCYEKPLDKVVTCCAAMRAMGDTA